MMVPDDRSVNLLLWVVLILAAAGAVAVVAALCLGVHWLISHLQWI